MCLNQNEISSLESCEKLLNLKELQVNFNYITTIDYIQKLEKLEILWLSENKISKIENIPSTVKSLNLATNLIEKLNTTNEIDKYFNIEELNLANNFFLNLEDIFVLARLPKLKQLNFNDVNYGENPICTLNNYRVLIHS